MLRIEPGDSYVTSVLPAVVVFGIGLTLVVAPVTATVLAAADSRHSGIASGINNAVARVAGLLAVAVLPLIAGLTGDKFYDPAAMDGRLPHGDGGVRRAVRLGWHPGLGDDQLRGAGGRARGHRPPVDRSVMRRDRDAAATGQPIAAPVAGSPARS